MSTFDTVTIENGATGPNQTNHIVRFHVYDLNEEQPYLVKAISGITSFENELTIEQNRPWHFFKRNEKLKNDPVVILLKLNPYNSAKKTISELRHDIYRMSYHGFSLNDRLTINFWKGTKLVMHAPGWVTKIEASPYSQETELQLTFERSLHAFISGINNFTGLNASMPYTITYNGNAISWPLFEFTRPAGPGVFTLKNETTGQYLQMNGPTFTAPQAYEANLLSQALTYVINGNTLNAGLYISPGSHWWHLVPGTNVISASGITLTRVWYYTFTVGI